MLFSPRALPSDLSGGGHVSAHSRSLGLCSLHQFQTPWLCKRKSLGNHWQIINTKGFLLVVLQDFEYFLGCQSHRHLPCNIIKKGQWKWRKNTHHLLLGALALDPAFLQVPCVGMGCCKSILGPSHRVVCCLAVRRQTRSRT